MKTRKSRGIAVFVAAFCLCHSVAAADRDIRQPNRPNILLLLSDDQRWDALGCLGNSVIQTPNLDRLAANGVLFRNNFCATSICSASRASIFTGQYECRHRIDDFAKPLPPAVWSNSYPAVLRRHGYVVGFIGKFGVGETMPVSEFDYWAGFPGQGSYFEPGRTEHLTALMERQAIEFLRARDGSQPFCLAISFKAPHAQDGAPRLFPPDPRDEHLYADVMVPPPITAAETYFTRLPKFIQNSENRTRWQSRFSTPGLFQQSVRDYYRLITGLDRTIGNIIAELHTRGFDRHTVILFTSDNGLFLGDHGLADKWLMYEESIRTPLIISDPRLAARRHGSVVNEMTLNVDLAPTILDLVGLRVPNVMQGRSLRPLVEGARVAWRQDWFYEHHFDNGGTIPPSEGVRTTDWKYIRYVATAPPYEELFHLTEDPFETNNLATNARFARTLRELRDRWAAYKEELK